MLVISVGNTALFGNIGFISEPLLGLAIAVPVRPILRWQEHRSDALAKSDQPTTNLQKSHYTSSSKTPRMHPRQKERNTAQPVEITHDGGSHKTTRVGLVGRYGNPNTAIRELLLAWNRGKVNVGTDDHETQEPQNRSSGESRGRNPTPLTDSQVDAIRNLRMQGMSVTSLAKRFSVHRSTIWEKTRPR